MSKNYIKLCVFRDTNTKIGLRLTILRSYENFNIGGTKGAIRSVVTFKVEIDKNVPKDCHDTK